MNITDRIQRFINTQWPKVAMTGIAITLLGLWGVQNGIRYANTVSSIGVLTVLAAPIAYILNIILHRNWWVDREGYANFRAVPTALLLWLVYHLAFVALKSILGYLSGLLELFDIIGWFPATIFLINWLKPNK